MIMGVIAIAVMVAIFVIIFVDYKQQHRDGAFSKAP